MCVECDEWQSVFTVSVRPKKNCLFPISDRPYQNMCDPNLFDGFPEKKKKKKKKKNIFF